MSGEKSKKTKLFLGAVLPATPDLAAAITAASVGFGCTVLTMNGFGYSRGTVTDDPVHCDVETPSFDDTDDLKIDPFNATLLVDSANTDYQATSALALQMIKDDTQGTFVLVEPNGTDKLWCEVKVTKWEIERGGPNDKKKLTIQLIARSEPLTV